MLNCELNIQIAEPFQGYVNRDWLQRVVEQTLSAQGIASSVELGLVITDDQTMRKLNRDYRNLDQTTDVISFALLEPGPEATLPFVMPPDEVLHLGEVIVSYPQAAKQAEEHLHPLEQEIALLVTHGILHLLGYNDEEGEAEQKMRAMETRVLSSLPELK